MGRRGASPKQGERDNHKIRWPKIMTQEQQDQWYGKVDLIRSRLIKPPKRIFLPAARVFVEIEEVF